MFCGGKGVYRNFAFLVVDWCYFKKARRNFLSINARLSGNRTFIEPAESIASCLFVLFSEDDKKSEPIATFQVVVVVLQCPDLAESSQRLQVTTYKKKISYYGNYEHHSKFCTGRTIDDVRKPSENPNCSKTFHAV